MTLKIEYGPLIKAKMQRRLDEADELYPPMKNSGRGRGDSNRQLREDYIKEKTGMGLGYLKGCIAGSWREPSGRVIKNMGIEVWYKDPETGEMELQKVIGRCEIDHSQQTSPASTSD